jgi:hypothetical protein
MGGLLAMLRKFVPDGFVQGVPYLMRGILKVVMAEFSALS